MIKQIFTYNDFDIPFLGKTYYGRKLLSYLRTYGCNYEFCRFYAINDDGVYAYMFQINSTLVICSEFPLPCEELSCYISLYRPYRVEAPFYIINALNKVGIEGYKKLKRTCFEFKEHQQDNEFDVTAIDDKPDLQKVYQILYESFPTMQDYGLWLTDTSRRVRRNISKVYTYKDCTTATVLFDVNDNVVIGQVATKTKFRGRKYARELLYWLCSKLKSEGKNVTLFALDYRESFYQEIGFAELSTENVLQQIDEL